MKNLVVVLLFFMCFSVATAQNTGTNIELEITDIESDEGQIRIGLYASDVNWLKKIYKSGTSTITNGKSTFTFIDIPDGIYAVSVFHDENNDGKLETNFLGIPTEDTGASNNAPARFGPPKWGDAKFEVGGKTIKQIIKL